MEEPSRLRLFRRTLLVFHARNEGLFISVCPVFKWSGSTADVQLCWSFHRPAVFSGLLVTVLSIFASSLQSLGFAAGHLRQPLSLIHI